jgi:Zn finger protein HypA/HybF involved in hydrogenase expression
MHEHVFVADIVKEASKHGKVSKVTVEVGALAPIPAVELESALKLTTGWDIEIIENAGAVQCKCGYHGAPRITDKGHDYTMYECPKCKTKLPRIVSGKDIILKDVTIED